MNDSPFRICFSYRRFSNGKQDKGNSLKRQIDLAESYCHRLNLVLDDSRQYEDKAISGFNGKNAVVGHLAEFLKLIKSGQIPPGSVLLIESLDRLSRDQIRSARDRLEDILEAGIEIHTLSPERVYNRESLSDSTALILMILEFAKAFEYSEQLSRRLSAAWDAKHQKAREEKLPFSKRTYPWLKVVDKQYVIIPEIVRTVELIFTLCANGLGMNLIVRELVRRGIAPFNGKKWTESTISQILMGDEVLGHHTPERIDPTTRKRVRREKVLNIFPPVISPVLYNQAKQALKSRKNKGGRVDFENGPIHPFMGLLQNRSGNALRVKYRAVDRKSANPRMVPYLHDRENSNTYSLHAFEQIMFEWLIQFEPAPIKKQNSSEITKLEEEIAGLDTKIQVLKEGVIKDPNWQNLLEILRTTEKEREQKTNLLEELQAIQPLDQGFSILWAQLYSLWDIDGMVVDSVPLIDMEKARKEKREALLEVRGTLRRMIKNISVTIGRESRACEKKSLKITVTFRDGTTRDFTHEPRPNQTETDSNNGKPF